MREAFHKFLSIKPGHITVERALLCAPHRPARMLDRVFQRAAVALIGDFTREDPAIARELQEFSGGGLPLVLVYSKDATKPPQKLPVLLSPSIVLDALDKAAQ